MILVLNCSELHRLTKTNRTVP